MIGRLTLMTLLALVSSTASVATDLSSRWEALYGKELTFDVYRKGRKVGSYSTAFESRDQLLSVDIKMELEIPILFGWTYDYSYKARELWLGNDILSLNVSVNDNGDVKTLSAEKIDNKLSGILNDETLSVALPLLPTHHYNADVLDDKRVFNTLTGRENAVVIVREGSDVVDTANGTIEADKFRYSGDLKDTTVWYDKNNRWVKMSFPGTDGTLIELRCTSCEKQR